MLLSLVAHGAAAAVVRFAIGPSIPGIPDAWVYSAWAAANIADSISTILCLRLGRRTGAKITERVAVVRWFISRLGIVGGSLAHKIVVAGAFTAVYSLSTVFLAVMTCLMAVVALHNLRTYLRYRKLERLAREYPLFRAFM